MASGHVTALKGRTHGRTDQCCTREESPCQLGAVHTWKSNDRGRMSALGPKADINRRAPSHDVCLPSGSATGTGRLDSCGPHPVLRWPTVR
jgi:hypothetical protein